MFRDNTFNAMIESFSGIPIVQDDALLFSVWNEIRVPTFQELYQKCLTDCIIYGNISL